MDPKVQAPANSVLTEVSTTDLIKELRKRSLGFLLCAVTLDESGDFWCAEKKGSLPFVEAMHFFLEDRFLPSEDEDNDQAVKVPS